jgi:hypothetical protein
VAVVALPPQRVVFGTTLIGNTPIAANAWVKLIGDSGAVINLPAQSRAAWKRVLFQNQGVTQNPAAGGNVRLFPDGNASLATTDGLLLPAPTPAAGPLLPSTFIDEVPCLHTGEWWCIADTTGLVLVVMIWR